MMQTAVTIVQLISLAAILCSLLYLWHAIDSIKDGLEDIKYVCNNNSEIGRSEYILRELINKSHKELLMEIACLATKNNEDIKRMKGDYAVGDILRFGGTRWRVFSKATLDDGRTRWKLFGENGGDAHIYSDSVPADIEFLGHRDLSFD